MHEYGVCDEIVTYFLAYTIDEFSIIFYYIDCKSKGVHINMDEKTKSIVIGLVSAFAAVLIIILLFFTITGINGSGDDNKGKVSSRDHGEVISVDSDGQRVVIIDDEDDDDDDDESSETSSDVSSEDKKVNNTGFFGRSDIEGITSGINTFADYVNAVDPVSYEWNTDKIKATGEVEVRLTAYDKSYAVIGVPYKAEDYTINGEIEGSGKDVTEWEIYGKCKKKECRAKEIVWLSNKMGFTLPRGVKIGTDYPDISEAYYKDPNPAKSYILYEMKDVITDSAKVKKYNKAKLAYVGGKLYKTTTMIEYNYKDNPDAYPFANNSKNIIRYGFNSIVDTDDASTQWYIDYATMNSRVIGVYYQMKGPDD